MSRPARPIPGITLTKEPRGPWFGSLSLSELKARTELRRVSGGRNPPEASQILPAVKKLIDERHRIIALAETGEFDRYAKPGAANHIPAPKLLALFSDAEQHVLHEHSRWTRNTLLPWRERRDLLDAAKQATTGVLPREHQDAARQVLDSQEQAALNRFLAKRRAGKA